MTTDNVDGGVVLSPEDAAELMFDTCAQLRRARHNLGWPRAKISDRAGTADSSVSLRENGRRPTSLAQFFQWCAALGVYPPAVLEHVLFRNFDYDWPYLRDGIDPLTQSTRRMEPPSPRTRTILAVFLPAPEVERYPTEITRATGIHSQIVIYILDKAVAEGRATVRFLDSEQKSLRRRFYQLTPTGIAYVQQYCVNAAGGNGATVPPSGYDD